MLRVAVGLALLLSVAGAAIVGHRADELAADHRRALDNLAITRARREQAKLRKELDELQRQLESPDVYHPARLGDFPRVSPSG